MAIADANYRFIAIDVGDKGSDGDANVFSQTELGQMIKEDNARLLLPQNAVLGNTYLPYCFIGDDAFPLLKRLIKPYSKRARQEFPPEETIFNYRLSRARRCVENAFGILVEKWFCVSNKLQCHPETAKYIIAACCALHNMLINRRHDSYVPERFRDRVNEQGQFVEGNWRELSQREPNILPEHGPAYEQAQQVRSIVKDFI